jgi:hypothetical protein
MKPLQRVAFIGLSSASVRNRHLYPRSSSGVSTARPDLETSVVAMTDLGRTYDYPPPYLSTPAPFDQLREAQRVVSDLIIRSAGQDPDGKLTRLLLDKVMGKLD